MVFHGGFAWIVSEINQGRIFPEMEWGKEFLWESNGDCNNNNSNSNHIRLVPALNESGRGKMAFLGILSCGRQLEKWLLHGRVKGSEAF